MNRYVLIKSVDLVGLMMIIFIKESVKENLRNIDSIVNRTGLLGTMGNKGSVMMKFNYNDTSFALANCHLSADMENNSSRIYELLDVFNKSFPKDANKKVNEY